MNKVFLSGRLTRDVETANTVAKVGIAVDRAFSKNKEVDFFNLIAFGKTAEFLGKYFSKGSKVLIEGRLRFAEYTNRQGEKRTSVEVIVDNIEFADGKRKVDNDFNGAPADNYDTPF